LSADSRPAKSGPYDNLMDLLERDSLPVATNLVEHLMSKVDDHHNAKMVEHKKVPDAACFSVKMATETAHQTNLKTDTRIDDDVLWQSVPPAYDYRHTLQKTLQAPYSTRDGTMYGPIDVEADAEPGVPVPDRHANILLQRRV
jgi:hypothetical protein